MNLIQQLFEAIKKNDVKSIENLIGQKGMKEYIDIAFIKSAELGHLEIIKYLIEEAPTNIRADIHAEDNRAFLWAANHRQWEVIQYLISKGIPEDFNNNYVYKEMLNDNNIQNSSLFIELQNHLKEKIINCTDKELDKYELEFLKTQDIEIKDLIEETKLKRLESFKDPQVIKSTLMTAIKNKSYSIIRDCLNKIKINEETFDALVKLENNEINDILLSKVDLNDKNETLSTILKLDERRHFASFSTNTDYVFKLLEKDKNELIGQKNCTVFDNYPDFEDIEKYYSKRSCLERYYGAIKYDNNYQAFSAQLLNQVLSVFNTNENNIEILNHLIKNRELLALKDEHIVQFLVENNYYLTDINDKSYHQKFKYIIDLLIENNVSFISDVNGYLIHIVVYNNPDYALEMIEILEKNGSNLSTFINHLNDENYWINEYDYENSEEPHYDCTYDIYKKFDNYGFYDEDKNSELIELYLKEQFINK